MAFRPLRSIAAAAIAGIVLAGCSDGSSGALRSAPAPVAGSYVRPNAQFEPSLLYVTSAASDDVSIYAFPSGTPQGKLRGFDAPTGLCVDAKANVWIANGGAAQLVKYAHGGSKPIGAIQDVGEFPEGCAIDAKSGNLAVTNFQSATGGSGNVSIYPGAAGKPTVYTDPGIAKYRFCAYDDKGNLYVDGANAQSQFVLAELPHGATALRTIPLQASIGFPGGVQFDGTDIAVGDSNAPKIYRTHGDDGKVVGTVDLANAVDVNQFWIVPPVSSNSNATEERLVAPSQGANFVGIYAYPGGDLPRKRFDMHEPYAAAVSAL